MDRSILIIDDSRHFAESVSELLSEEQWAIDIALNGEEGLRKLSERHFDVVLLDLKMPGMSGLEFLQHLESRGMQDRNYVIVLTGEITIENAVDSLRLGARDFIQKPAVVEQPELFFRRIEKGFQWQEQRAVHDELLAERKRSVEESRLIVKSVGHDISGSYFSSLMLRLRMLEKNFQKISSILAEAGPITSEHKAEARRLAEGGRERLADLITLMDFIKDLGNKLKHLGEAISSDGKNMVPIDLSELAQKSLELFAINKPNIVVRREFFSGELQIVGNAEDLNRVFMNMMENAVRAMPDGGTLSLRTYPKDGLACVDIADTGIGIAPEVQDKIWRPDYTNWRGESGTGLGLLICKKVVENHQGRILLQSAPGQGTTFTLQFKKLSPRSRTL
jgi:two-component system sensor histidine kinase/response regulator